MTDENLEDKTNPYHKADYKYAYQIHIQLEKIVKSLERLDIVTLWQNGIAEHINQRKKRINLKTDSLTAEWYNKVIKAKLKNTGI